jgi:hypothetical protein
MMQVSNDTVFIVEGAVRAVATGISVFGPDIIGQRSIRSLGVYGKPPGMFIQSDLRYLRFPIDNKVDEDCDYERSDNLCYYIGYAHT